MAHQILPYYSLCPLIEQDSFLGLMKDIDGDTAVVTVNAKTVSRYQISNPSQLLACWNSKSRITSACIYDAGKDRYIAIFNDNELRIWTAADENIDKVNKNKFTEKLFKLLICPKTGKVILVFRKGSVFYLDDVLKYRKSSLNNQCISSEDKILSCDVYVSPDPMVIFVIEDKSGRYRVIGTSIVLKILSELKELVLDGKEFVLDAKELVFDAFLRNTASATLLGHCLLVDKDIYLLTIWSDGKLYRVVVRGNAEIAVEKHLTTLENVNLNYEVIMKVLSPYYVAICGKKDNGILLIIYSLKYNLIQCQKFYKDCQTVSQIWNFESKLFLIYGHNLIVTPYAQENRKLSSLLGSGIHQQPDCIEILPESEICRSTIPSMLEKDDIEGISNMLDAHADIPDSVLIDILFWSLQDEARRKKFLDKILDNYIVSDISYLRKIFNIDLALVVLDYLMTNLDESNVVNKLVKWASMFIDAFYSQLIMSNDAVIVEKLKSYIKILQQECDYLDSYKQLNSVMSCIKRKKIISF